MNSCITFCFAFPVVFKQLFGLGCQSKSVQRGLRNRERTVKMKRWWTYRKNIICEAVSSVQQKRQYFLFLSVLKAWRCEDVFIACCMVFRMNKIIHAPFQDVVLKLPHSPTTCIIPRLVVEFLPLSHPWFLSQKSYPS